MDTCAGPSCSDPGPADRLTERCLSPPCHCSKGYIHRDIKIDNVMLADPGDLASVRLIDFNFAVKATSNGLTRGVCGTVGFNAPEVVEPTDDDAVLRSPHASRTTLPGILSSEGGSARSGRSRITGTPLHIGGGAYSYAADMWSAGVVAYVSLTGQMPFRWRMSSRFQHGVRQEMWMAVKCMASQYTRGDPWRTRAFEHLSETAQDLLVSMLQWDPEDRITAAEALEHPFFGAGRKTLYTESTASARNPLEDPAGPVQCKRDVNGECIGSGARISSSDLASSRRRKVCELMDGMAPSDSRAFAQLWGSAVTKTGSSTLEIEKLLRPAHDLLPETKEVQVSDAGPSHALHQTPDGESEASTPKNRRQTSIGFAQARPPRLPAAISVAQA